MQTSVQPSPGFPDHALLDSGGGEKLERYGRVVLRRPDPQALWRPRLDPEAWAAAAHLSFVRESDRGGRWEAAPGAPPEARAREPEWTVGYGPARFVIRPTSFKHVGLFPEHAATWERLARLPEELGVARPRLLNLFGYTGAASVLAHVAGFEVTHVDASRAALAWLRENLRASDRPEDALRLVLDDALAFARREVRRGARYDVVLLDPPHYGRGPKGETWRLEGGLAELVEAVGRLAAERALVVLTTYAVGHSPLALANLLAELEGGAARAGELALREEERAGLAPPRLLPAGFCARWARGVELDG